MTQNCNKRVLIMLPIMRWSFAAALTLIIAGCAGPQKTASVNDSAAPLEAEAIVVHSTEADTDDLYRDVANAIQDHGFSIANSDAKLRSLSTEPRTLTSGITAARDVQISASVRENPTRAILSGTVGGQAIRKYGQQGSPLRVAWAEMHAIAESLSDSLSYRQPR